MRRHEIAPRAFLGAAGHAPAMRGTSGRTPAAGDAMGVGEAVAEGAGPLESSLLLALKERLRLSLSSHDALVWDSTSGGLDHGVKLGRFI